MTLLGTERQIFSIFKLCREDCNWHWESDVIFVVFELSREDSTWQWLAHVFVVFSAVSLRLASITPLPVSSKVHRKQSLCWRREFVLEIHRLFVFVLSISGTGNWMYWFRLISRILPCLPNAIKHNDVILQSIKMRDVTIKEWMTQLYKG